MMRDTKKYLSSAKSWSLLLVLTLPCLLLLPTILWPHYGLFSDSWQLIELPKAVIDRFPHSLDLLKPLEDGRWSPVFHGLSVLIYGLAPDSPRAFYISQWLMLMMMCISLIWIIHKVTERKLLAVLAVLLLCTASSFFESFYTLDKFEPRMSVFVALFLASLVKVLFCCKRLDDGLSWKFFSMQLVLGAGIVFSKETGLFLCGALFAIWIGTVFNPALRQAYGPLVRRMLVVQLFVVLAYFALFKLLAPAMSYRYVSYDLTATLVLQNVSYYFMYSPELAIGLLLAGYWMLQLFFRKFARVDPPLQLLLYLLSFSLFAYFAGICLWRSTLDYYLLPAHLLTALLIPLSLYALASPLKRLPKAVKVIIAGIIVLGWSIFFVFRVYSGVAIFAFDSVKDDLAETLARPSYINRSVVLPFANPISAEVGERLKFFTNRIRDPKLPVDLFNFWEPLSPSRLDLNRFEGQAGEIPSKSQLATLATIPEGAAVWQFSGYGALFSSSDGKTFWRYRLLAPGDLILWPSGSSGLRRVNARGVGMHTGKITQLLEQSPFALKRVAVVSRGIGPVFLSWEVFEVQQHVAEGGIQ